MVFIPWGYGPQQVSRMVAEWFWESQPLRVKASYAKPEDSEWYPKYRGTREILREVGGPTPQG